MEKILNIKAHDEKDIETWFNSSEKTESLIVFVHGLTGSPFEHHYIQAPSFFNPKGYDVVRFAQYGGEGDARIISETGIPTHAKDLDSVVSHFTNDYQHIYLVGHSLGAPVILESNLDQIEKIVLWDPTYGIKSIEEAKRKPCLYDERIDKYVLVNSGKEILLGQEMMDSWVEASNLEKYIGLISKPCKFIFAAEEDKKDVWTPHLENIQTEWESSVIAGASHVFYEEGTLQKLYQETLDWITN